MIWANRFASGTSFGPEKLIYIMGGVDNQFAPKTEPTTPIATENNYIFQTLVTNMRGFYQNVRNGNSFAVVNSELRWPIFSYLVQKPIRSDFIKNFQLVGFGDIGTAWNGLTPYSDENAINTETIDRENVVIILDSQKDPIVYSYGFGSRTRLFGYFLRFDWGWPIEDGVVLDNEFMFSIGTDF
ncbi:MAG: BamA/TamA family outer membrane protein [Owenweeksia sp.]|nr:BamA/TamA family outer membrane protein [Owenweeksia sp.]